MGRRSGGKHGAAKSAKSAAGIVGDVGPHVRQADVAEQALQLRVDRSLAGNGSVPLRDGLNERLGDGVRRPLPRQLSPRSKVLLFREQLHARLLQQENSLLLHIPRLAWKEPEAAHGSGGNRNRAALAQIRFHRSNQDHIPLGRIGHVPDEPCQPPEFAQLGSAAPSRYALPGFPFSRRQGKGAAGRRLLGWLGRRTDDAFLRRASRYLVTQIL